jgi:hypothetical protein
MGALLLDPPIARLDVPGPGLVPMHGMLCRILDELLTHLGLGVRRAKLD